MDPVLEKSHFEAKEKPLKKSEIADHFFLFMAGIGKRGCDGVGALNI